jgi:hypothetical protein
MARSEDVWHVHEEKTATTVGRTVEPAIHVSLFSKYALLLFLPPALLLSSHVYEISPILSYLCFGSVNPQIFTLENLEG